MTDPIAATNASLPPEWRITRHLDEGGQGMVFLGEVHGTEAAIKLFSRLDDDRRVSREVALLRSIDTQEIVRVIDHSNVAINGLPCLAVAYEFHPGGNLLSMAQAGATTCEACTVARDIALAVQTLWSHRVVHRDIKPANIIRRQDGGYVLVDFGLAGHLDLSQVTAPGASPGTHGYKSPEQAAGRRQLTYRSDLYSLAVSLYELITGAHPFGRQQPRANTQLPAHLSTRAPELPRAFADGVMKCLSPIPTQRPAQFCDICITACEDITNAS